MTGSSSNNEKILLQKIAESDVQAFRQIFDLYKKRLFAAAMKITKSEYAAEEIVQEIFTALWEGRKNLQNVADPPAYIFTIAYNRSFRYLKRVANEKQLLVWIMNRAENLSNETEEWLNVREGEALIRQAVQNLPAQRRLIYSLSREQGLSHEEIAARLQISPLTVKKQIVLALRDIRANLAKTAPLLAIFFSI